MDFSKTLLEQLGTVTCEEFVQSIAERLVGISGTPTNVITDGVELQKKEVVEPKEDNWYLQASIARACDLSEHELSKLHLKGHLDAKKVKVFVFLNLDQVKDRCKVDDAKIDKSKLIPLKGFDARRWSRNKVCRAGYMSTKQVADLIDEPVAFVTDLCRNDFLPYVRLTPRSKYEIPADAAIEYVKKYKKNYKGENLNFFEGGRDE